MNDSKTDAPAEYRKKEKPPFSESNLGVFEVLLPFKSLVTEHKVFKLMGQGEFPIEDFRKTLLNFFPLVENFPKFMALNLAKTKFHKPGHEDAKYWLISNIHEEQTHAIWYMDWARGFGVPKEDIINVVPSPAMEAVVNHLWKVSSYESVAVCLAATNIGIEWATGAWSLSVKKGVESYLKRGIVQQDKQIMTWVTAHSIFDDAHPYEAMDLVVKSAEDENDFQDALKACQRSLEYYAMALDDCIKLP